MPADCEARFYGDKRWHPAVRGKSLNQGSAEVVFVGFEGDPPQETKAADIRKLGWGRGSSSGSGGARPSGGGNRRYIELNKALMGAADAPALQQLVRDHAAEFNQVNATTALQRLAKAGALATDPDGEAALGLLVARTAQLLERPEGGRWEPRQLSTALWGLARLRLASGSGPVSAGQRQLADGLAAAATRVALARGFRPQEMANSVWAAARLGQSSPDLLAALADASAERINEFTAQGMSNTVWGMATLGSAHPVLMEAMASGIKVRVAELNAQEISNTLWAFAKLEPKLRGSTAEGAPHRLLQAVAAVLPQLLNSNAGTASAELNSGLTAQHLANLAWAVAQLGDRATSDHAGAVEAVAIDFAALFVEPIVQRAGSCNARELAMVAWATATAATGETGAAAVAPALDAIGASVLSLLADGDQADDNSPLSPGQLSTFVWAFARLRIPAPALMEAVARVVCPRLEEFSWHDISLLLWAYARLQCELPDLMLKKVARSIRRRLKQEIKDRARETDSQSNDPLDDADNDGAGFAPELEGGQSSSSTSTSRPRHLATLIWSFGTLEVQDEKLATSIADAALPRLEEFSPRDLANMTWGFATLGTPAPLLLKRLAQVGGQRMADFTAQECSQFLWACDKAGVADEPTLDQSTRQRRAKTFEFPALDGVGQLSGPAPGEVTIEWQPAGRGLAHTGLAPWDASYVLAEWISRHPSPASLPALQELLGGTEDGGGGTWKQWADNGRGGVELGAGVGLLSIVAARLGVSMVATDGDEAVLGLLQENVSRQAWASGKEEPVRVSQLKWGAPAVLESLGLHAAVGLVLATGVVYGSDPEGWSGLVDSIIQLSDESTLVLLAHGQGAAPGLHRTEGPFFDRVAKHFNFVAVPMHTIHPSYRRSGCVIHALRRRPGSVAATDPRNGAGSLATSGLAALDGERGKRVTKKRPASGSVPGGRTKKKAKAPDEGATAPGAEEPTEAGKEEKRAKGEKKKKKQKKKKKKKKKKEEEEEEEEEEKKKKKEKGGKEKEKEKEKRGKKNKKEKGKQEEAANGGATTYQ